ncbi:MAG: M4 family metallopeptidase [Hyphomicrobiaceae bacterium]|nr:M4 family metallopeptidase [Hyphomicrobiaceae bacterium]
MSHRLLGIWAMAGLMAALTTGAPLTSARAADPDPNAVKRIVEDARRTNPSLRVRIDPATGMPKSVRGLRPAVDPDVSLGASRNAAGTPSEADVIRAAETFFKTGELAAAYTARNGRTEVSAFRVRRDPDFPGQSVVHVEQRLDGVPVFGSSGRVMVSPSLAVTQLSTTFSTVDVETTTPKVEKDAAISAARAHLRGVLASKRDKGGYDRLRANLDTIAADASLVVFDPALQRRREANPGPARLAWLTIIDEFRVFVDASSGEVLFFYADKHSLAPRRVFDLQDRSEFPGVKLIDDTTGEKADPLPTDASDAYANAGHVLGFFDRVFKRGGVYQEDGEVLSAYVRYGGTKYAHWCNGVSFGCPERGAMVYGTAAAGAIDIVGHEMTHGIISAEAELTYANESGAVNEALADIFGTLVEFDLAAGNANWVMGERMLGYSLTAAVRSMANPTLFDPDGNSLFDRSKPYSPLNRGQPDHYDDYVTREDPICETTNDYFNGCVHFNSGILNKLAWLSSEGGRHRGVVVKGIGRDKLGRIAYRALVVHMNPSSTLKDAAEGFETACLELAGANVAGFVSSDCDRVRNAQIAVGLLPLGS